MSYDPMMVQPMREELTRIGVKELRTPAEVDAFLTPKTGTTLLVINSVCGCAAGNARPGIRLALDHQAKPDRVATVFAGQDLEATAKARTYFPQFPPSSPSFVFLKDGKPAHYIPRHQIEGRDPLSVANDLIKSFESLAKAPAR